MVRRWLVAAVLALTPVLALAGPASAGGGCHSGVTTGKGDTVTMVDACFTPTTLYVDPGTTVTWVNKDPMTHNVTANQWGYFDPMDQGDVTRATFDEPGIYPYACTYHPGMSGAIVVGDGKGAGSGETVVVESWQPTGAPEEAAPGAELAAATEASARSWPVLPWLGGAVLGFVVAVAGGAARAASRPSGS